MKCPLKREVTKDNYGNSYDNSPDCLKEECGVWDKETQECSQLSEEKALRGIAALLATLVNKMPHSGQFLK